MLRPSIAWSLQALHKVCAAASLLPRRTLICSVFIAVRQRSQGGPQAQVGGVGRRLIGRGLQRGGGG